MKTAIGIRLLNAMRFSIPLLLLADTCAVFLSTMVGRVDWNALYKACNRECDKETINGNGEQFINVREFA